MLQFLPDGFISDPLEIPLEDSSFVGLQGCWGMLGDAGGCLTLRRILRGSREMEDVENPRFRWRIPGGNRIEGAGRRWEEVGEGEGGWR